MGGVDNSFKYKAIANTNLDNYNLNVSFKKLFIKKIETPIDVTAETISKEYDGALLSSNNVDYDKSILKGSDQLKATTSGSIIQAGSVTNVIDDVKIYRDGVDATANYTIGKFTSGILTVNKRSISVSSEDKTFTYNGKAQS